MQITTANFVIDVPAREGSMGQRKCRFQHKTDFLYGNFIIEVKDNQEQLIQNTTPECCICGEETGGTPTSSLYGSVHKWGPTSHTFEPVVSAQVPEEVKDALRRTLGVKAP